MQDGLRSCALFKQPWAGDVSMSVLETGKRWFLSRTCFSGGGGHLVRLVYIADVTGVYRWLLGNMKFARQRSKVEAATSHQWQVTILPNVLPCLRIRRMAPQTCLINIPNIAQME
jgi:hypothetical protein